MILFTIFVVRLLRVLLSRPAVDGLSSVSRFAYNGFTKAICQLTIDVKSKTISYDQISGSELPVFVVLAIMGTNKHWFKIVANEADIADDQFLMDKFGSNGNVIESYIAHTGETVRQKN